MNAGLAAYPSWIETLKKLKVRNVYLFLCAHTPFAHTQLPFSYMAAQSTILRTTATFIPSRHQNVGLYIVCRHYSELMKSKHESERLSVILRVLLAQSHLPIHLNDYSLVR